MMCDVCKNSSSIKDITSTVREADMDLQCLDLYFLWLHKNIL
jgi:hypothetical protein